MLPSAAELGSEQGVHSSFGFFASNFQGAGELEDGGGAASGTEEALGSLQVLAVIETVTLRGEYRFLPAYEGEELITIAGGSP